MSEQQQELIFSVEKIYLKDLSLEIPNAPQVFGERETPKIDLSLRNDVGELEAGVYEVVLTCTITAKARERTVFLVEAAQAGIFQLRNLPKEQLDHALNVYCGTVLFPYLRETVSNVVSRGGFPPFVMNHVSFEQLYEERLQQQQQQQQSSTGNAQPQ